MSRRSRRAASCAEPPVVKPEPEIEEIGEADAERIRPKLQSISRMRRLSPSLGSCLSPGLAPVVVEAAPCPRHLGRAGNSVATALQYPRRLTTFFCFIVSDNAFFTCKPSPECNNISRNVLKLVTPFFNFSYFWME